MGEIGQISLTLPQSYLKKKEDLPVNLFTYFLFSCVHVLSCFSRVRLFATLWTLWTARLFCSWNSPGKNTGVGSQSLLQGIFLTQGSNLGLPHCRQILYPLSHQRSCVIQRKGWVLGNRERRKETFVDMVS